jgi:hypothetical protein
MDRERRIPLDRIRTDGWFERVGESIASFRTLCDVLGERFFAFALIVGARVSSLMIDRFNPDQSLVEFTLGGIDGEPNAFLPEVEERVTVVEFRRRLVAALVSEENRGPLPEDLGDDMESLQRFIGPRTLLLAPLYGYGLKQLVIARKSATVRLDHEGKEKNLEVEELRQRLKKLVRDDLARGVERKGGTAIDLNRVAEAEKAAETGDWRKIQELLGTWPMPLAIYWRTPEGQLLPDQARQRIAEGLGLLGTALAKLGDDGQGEEVLRLAVQYAQEGTAARTIFLRVARVYLDSARYGEALGPLRRAKGLGAPAKEVLPDLARAFAERGRYVAAMGCVREAKAARIASPALDRIQADVARKLGPGFERWRKLVDG